MSCSQTLDACRLQDEFFDAGILPKQQEDVEMEMDMDTDETPAAPARKAQPAVEEEPEEEIKVVSDYQPRVAAPTSKRPATVIDPVSGKAVPVDQIGGTHSFSQLLVLVLLSLRLGRMIDGSALRAISRFVNRTHAHSAHGPEVARGAAPLPGEAKRDELRARRSDRTAFGAVRATSWRHLRQCRRGGGDASRRAGAATAARG